jgi:hypothetical protein
MPRAIGRRYPKKKATTKTRNQQQNNGHQDVHTKKMTIKMKCAPPYKPKKTKPQKQFNSKNKQQKQQREDNRQKQRGKDKHQEQELVKQFTTCEF